MDIDILARAIFVMLVDRGLLKGVGEDLHEEIIQAIGDIIEQAG